MPDNHTTLDVRETLRELTSRCGAIAQDPLSRGDVRTLAAGLALLGAVVDNIDARVRVLEPCMGRSDRGPHTWVPIGKKFAEDGDPLRCMYCGVTR